MDPQAYVALWVMFSVGAGILVGYCLAVGKRRHEMPAADAQRKMVLNALVELLNSTEQLTTNVDSHNSQMQQVHRQVGEMQTTGEMQGLQRTLLQHIAGMVESNQRLEDDLVMARSRMEEQAQELDRTRHEARTDALSGVANRKAFDEKLQLLLTTWRRTDKSFVLVLADVDHFKRINDTHGHQAGDRVVNHVGMFLRQQFGEADFVGRYGGDEFALLLPETRLEKAMPLVEHVRAQIASTNFDIGLRGEQATITFSIGVAGPAEGDTAEDVLKRADAGLYKSKQGGRNQVHCIQQEQEEPQTPAPDLTLDASQMPTLHGVQQM